VDVRPHINGIPVLLPRHRHDEFGDPGEHYHIDFRYHPEEPRQSYVLFTEQEPEYKPFEKVREVYHVPIQSCRISMMLAGRYRESKGCKVCPHKGLPIMNGICVGHGLGFNDNGDVLNEFEVDFVGNRVPINFNQREIYLKIEKSGCADAANLIALPDKIVAILKLNHPVLVTKGDSLRLTI